MINQHTDLRQMGRLLQKEQGWTQETLAKHIGVQRQQVCNWLNGSRGLPYNAVERLLWLMRFRDYTPQ